MDFGFEGFESADFETELEDFEIKKIKKFDRIWRHGFGGSICYSRAHGNKAYFGCMDHYIYCINAENGEEIWKFKTNGMVLSPVSEVYEDVIYVGGYGGKMYAIDFETGKEIWSFQASKEIFCLPFVNSEKLYFTSRDSNLYCLNTKDGREIWRFRMGDESAFSPVAYKGRVYVGSFDGNLYCLEEETGKEIWRFRTGGEVQSDNTLLVHEDVVYIPSWDNYLYALRADTGKELWRSKLGKLGLSSSPLVYQGVLYIGSRDGILFALDLNGKELWRFRTGGIVIGVGIKDGIIYLPSEDSNVYALNLDGKELWRFRAGGSVYDFPCFFNDNIYFGSWDCHLYCLNALNGKEKWRFTTSVQQQSYSPPPHEEFSIELKKETHIKDAISEEKYKSKKEKTFSLSDYQIESEYHTESEYKQKSDYDAEWIIFEDICIPEPDMVNDKLLTFARKA